VSIGLPVYNGERYLAAALDSLLAQSFTDFELIISDNASTDHTAAICEEYARRDGRVRYFRETHNTGGARNHNRVIELARGQYFKWAAHDDTYDPRFVERCVERLDADPGAVLCFSRSRFIDEQGQLLHEYAHPLQLDIEDRAARFFPYVFGTHIMVEDYGLIRTETLRKTPLHGNYAWADMVLFGELALYGRFVEIPEVLFFRREHPQRAMNVHRDPMSLNTWYDPRKAGERAFPTWRVLRDNLAVVGRVPLPWIERARLAIGVLRRGNWRRRQLVLELLTALRP
jgi:glycosyltransferase involved in cell wall biosynthesis